MTQQQTDRQADGNTKEKKKDSKSGVPKHFEGKLPRLSRPLISVNTGATFSLAAHRKRTQKSGQGKYNALAL